ncbi:hypothetical protein Nepgr_010931 [Nepenthes gracilis]|uniref:Uncharacterized protein n=1 Tax=Nepenthes gracilis TaxID=150966 RepID=A0AAD3XLW2_NEPGR|nr:hypothetical protein Nepgr_010931 [Nepenthes gracilis]
MDINLPSQELIALVIQLMIVWQNSLPTSHQIRSHPKAGNEATRRLRNIHLRSYWKLISVKFFVTFGVFPLKALVEHEDNPIDLSRDVGVAG